ncbi:MAG: hypothetical protein J6K31_01320 [Parabacteroides sp.]|nr:hypothetical protein [Parabacteroides sp.]
MNKKFSTLVAGLLLASSIGTVNADVINGSFAKYLTAPGAAKVVKAGTYYQLATATSGQVVAMLPDDNGGYTLKVVSKDDADKTDVRYTLWTIDVQGNPTDGYRYSFLNKGTNMILSIDPATALKALNNNAAATAVKGDISVWKWQDAPDPVKGFNLTNDAEALTSVFGQKNDSTVTLVAGSKGVYAVKYALNNKIDLATAQLKVVPAKPEAVVLGADDLNSMLWTTTPDGKLKLTFDKDVEGGNPAAVNLFTKQTYKAVPAVGYPANFGYIGDDGVWKVGVDPSWNNAGYDISLVSQYLTDGAYQVAVAKLTLLETAYKALGTSNAYADKEKLYNVYVEVLNLFQTNYTKSIYTKSSFSEVYDKYLEEITSDERFEVEGIDFSDPLYLGLKNAVRNYVLTRWDYADFDNRTSNDGTSKGTNAIVGEAVSTLYLQGMTDSKRPFAAESEMKKLISDAKSLVKTTKDAAEKDISHAVWNKKAANRGWVSLQANDETDDAKKTYLKVGIEFLTGASGNNAKHLKMVHATWKDAMPDATPINKTRQDLNGRYNFQFTWFPAEDSIVIRTAGFAVKPDHVANWEDMTVETNPDDLGMDKVQATPADEDVAPGTKPAELNLIKIAVLANNHREVTVGSSENKYGFTPATTINTKITIGNNGMYTKTTIPAGVYYFNLASNLARRSLLNGKYIVANFCGEYNEYANPEKDQIYGPAQNFDHMPRTQWVVEQNAGPIASERTINIYNREFPEKSAKNIQLYEGDNGTVFALFGDNKVPFVVGDTLSYTAVNADVLKENIGYKTYKDEDLLHYRYTMDYYSGMGIGHKVNVSAVEADSVVFVNAKVDEKGTELQLIKVKEEAYGYKGDVVGQLKRQLYKIRTYDGSKLSNNNKYIKRGGASWDSYVLTDDADDAALFYLKENNQLTVDGKTICYYALVEREDVKYGDESWTNYYRAGVHDGSLEFSVEQACAETRVATFSIERDNTPYYRRLGDTNKEDGFEDMKTANAKIFDAITGEYLYEDANSDYSKGKGINFLGIENKKVAVKNPTLYVDTAYVRGETMMPQYMLAVDVVEHKGKKECPIDPEHNTDEYLTAHPDGCPHAVATQDYKVGRYLISFADSVALSKDSKEFQYDRAYTRLGFVEAKHIGDTLVIYRNGVPGTATADSIFLGDNQPNKQTWALNADPSKNTKGDSIHAAHKYGIKNAVFAFRLVNDQPEADFLIETTVETPKATWGGWIKNQNGVPVIAKYGSYNEAALDALVFNIEPSTEEATANEGIATSEVTVIAGEGQLTIANAAGKKVVVSNILGQVVANTVLTSDNATIAAPQGVVVVAVEGEEAVKAIVK